MDQLIKRGAKFHGVALFDRVEKLHEVIRLGSIGLVLVG
jgi:hypothetical protein